MKQHFIEIVGGPGSFDTKVYLDGSPLLGCTRISFDADATRSGLNRVSIDLIADVQIRSHAEVDITKRCQWCAKPVPENGECLCTTVTPEASDAAL